MLKTIALTFVAFFASNQLTVLESDYDQLKNVSTVRIPQTGLSYEKGRYHRVSFLVEYSFPGKTPSPPAHVNFELLTVVKARQLNPDLYVVFVVNGEPIHFSSNRSAIRNPVRGKPWIGERMVFLIPREDFLKLAAAEKLAIKLGDVTIESNEEMRASLRALAEGIPR
ncbi:MAG TPA: hypothetical protein VJS13_01140 [Pyrinomonadaceae bacterium]|nr:hypothetical protein [Pyrinomonadaceae bacterium]